MGWRPTPVYLCPLLPRYRAVRAPSRKARAAHAVERPDGDVVEVSREPRTGPGILYTRQWVAIREGGIVARGPSFISVKQPSEPVIRQVIDEVNKLR
ncbi:MAG: hypothetical protein ACLF0G_14205 [Candidatus Brocadiia bacterium]